MLFHIVLGNVVSQLLGQRKPREKKLPHFKMNRDSFIMGTGFYLLTAAMPKFELWIPAMYCWVLHIFHTDWVS